MCSQSLAREALEDSPFLTLKYRAGLPNDKGLITSAVLQTATGYQIRSSRETLQVADPPNTENSRILACEN